MIDAAEGYCRLPRAARRGRDEASQPAVAWIGAPVPPAKLQEALDWMGAIREAGLEIVEAEEGR